MTKYSIKFPDYISWSLLFDEIFVFNELNVKITVLKVVNKYLWLSLEKCQDSLEVINYVMNEYNISFEKINEKIRYMLKQQILIMTVD